MQRLQINGVGAILDFAAESEAEGGFSKKDMAAYHESNTAALLSSIASAAKMADDGAEPFVAFKVPARRSTQQAASSTQQAARRTPHAARRTPRPPTAPALECASLDGQRRPQHQAAAQPLKFMRTKLLRVS